MNDALISDLRLFAAHPDVTLADTDESLRLRIERSGFAVTLVVPRSALEFFIEVHDAAGERLIDDWLDYAGYDATPEPQLAQEMRAEVLTFVRRLLQRNLRVARDGPRLEWEIGERWLQAIPFVPDTYPGQSPLDR